jgi:hypothetical protein
MGPARKNGISAMAKTRKTTAKRAAADFSGRWVSGSDWETEVVFVIAKRKGTYQITATDEWDGEKGEVHGIEAGAGTLRFAVYWSTGRFTKYRLRLLTDDTVEMTLTHTATLHYRRAARGARRT